MQRKRKAHRKGNPTDRVSRGDARKNHHARVDQAGQGPGQLGPALNRGQSSQNPLLDLESRALGLVPAYLRPLLGPFLQQGLGYLLNGGSGQSPSSGGFFGPALLSPAGTRSSPSQPGGSGAVTVPTPTPGSRVPTGK